MKSALKYGFTGFLVLLLACGSDPNGDGDGNGNGNGDGDASTGNGADGGAGAADANCAQTSSAAELVKKPVDIIFVIDNSGSMGEEIQGVQDNINQNFAQIIEASDVDYRVIMLTQHGPLPDESVCIEGPLSGIPQGGCTNPPAVPINNPPRFYHYNFGGVGSHDSWCRMLDRLTLPDDNGTAPNGYIELLRQDAFKIFVEVTDDGIGCSVGGNSFNDRNSVADGVSAAADFDAALLALAPEHFGTAEERNYRFYSLVALANLDPNNPATPWQPTDPVTTDECPTAADPGTGHQALSVLTEGLRFSLCEPSFYDVVFNEIAQGVIDGSAVSCEFEVPDPPPGEMIDYNTILVEYTDGSSGMAEEFAQVLNINACAPNSFFIDSATDSIILCDDTCNRVQADQNAEIQILFTCSNVID